MASLETKLQKQFDKSLKEPSLAKLVLPKYFDIKATQVSLFPATTLLLHGTDLSLPEKTVNGCIGKIDLIFRYKSRKLFVCEIKDQSPSNYSFWYATKALAYCEYYKWQTNSISYQPAVMIPKSLLKLENQIVAGKLGIAIFVFTVDKDGVFTIKPVSDEPHWKQNL